MVGLSAWSADVGLSEEAPQRAPGPACDGLFKVMFLNEVTILLQIYSGIVAQSLRGGVPESTY